MEKKIKWTKLKWIRHMKKDLKAIYVKERLNDETQFLRIPLSLAKRKSSRRSGDCNSEALPPLNPLYQAPQPIRAAKYRDLMNIMKDMPSDRQSFYHSLQVGEERGSSSEED